MAKSKKVSLPNKKAMNLYQPSNKNNDRIAVYGTLICLIVAVCVGILYVLPKYQEITNQQALNAELSIQVDSYRVQTAKYNQVKEEYYRYSEKLDDGQVQLVDRLVVLDIVTESIKDLGSVPAVTINENTVSINLTSENSAGLADIYEKLEANPYVTDIQVYYSNKDESGVVSSITFSVAEVEGN